jgi:SnoaL-like domain
MTHSATPAAPPQWLLQIMNEIDTLKFGDGFSCMTEDTDMYFGTGHVHGAEAIKAFFVRIDEPLNITHRVLEFWAADDGACFLHGEAVMAKKTDPGTAVRAPFMHIYYLDEGEPVRIRALRITAGPLQTDAVM